MTSQEEITQIRAELHKLLTHNCDGVIEIGPARLEDAIRRPCTGCTRYIELMNRLHDLNKESECPH